MLKYLFLFFCLVGAFIEAEAQNSFKVIVSNGQGLLARDISIDNCNFCTVEKAEDSVFLFKTNSTSNIFPELLIIEIKLPNVPYAEIFEINTREENGLESIVLDNPPPLERIDTSKYIPPPPPPNNTDKDDGEDTDAIDVNLPDT